jgi:hypothetical protein
MMMPKSDVFILLRNDGASMDKKDNQWSMMMHEDKCAMIPLLDVATHYLMGPTHVFLSPHILRSF